MSGTGRVIDVDRASIPNTNKPARIVTVDRDGDGVRLQFYTPLDAPAPAVGVAIEWGSHRCWWADQIVSKSREYDPNAPLL